MRFARVGGGGKRNVEDEEKGKLIVALVVLVNVLELMCALCGEKRCHHS